MQRQVQIPGGQIGIGPGFTSSLFGFPLLIIAQPWIRTHLCDIRNQAALYHILGL
jgi:hypothetical protein